MANLKECNFDEERLHLWWQEVKANPEGVLESPRQVIQQLLRITLESSMEELRRRITQTEWYEHAPDRRADYRNGFSYKDWSTDLGLIERIRIPRTRQKTGRALAAQIRRAYRKNKEHVHQLLREMFLAGVSTQRVGEVAQSLLGRKYSAAYVSQATKKLDQAVWEYHRRKLADRFVYLFFDGIALKGRDAVGAKDRLILVCHGIDLEGRRELLDFMIADSESEAAWYRFCNDLYRRGLEGQCVRLITTDGCPGLHAALDTIWPRIPRQRCWVHKLRNLLTKFLRKGHVDACMREAKRIYLAETKTEAGERFRQWATSWQEREPKVVACLQDDLTEMVAFFDCPKEYWRKIRTTNVIERVFREVRRRVRPMNCFKNDASCERILYAIFFYLNRRWLWKHAGRRQTVEQLLEQTQGTQPQRHPMELLPVH
jgi:transposase-like protein